MITFFRFVFCGALLAGAWSPLSGRAQEETAPLFIFTNGCGSITPYQYGQLLTVGQSYELTATPAPGFAFASWQPVELTALQTYILQGDNYVPLQEVISPNYFPVYYSLPELGFFMQPQFYVVSTNTEQIFSTIGWQANFVPVFSLQLGAVTNSQCALTLAGPAGVNYTLQMSTNPTATNWTTLGSITTTNGTGSFIVLNATNACQFYRAMVPVEE